MSALDAMPGAMVRVDRRGVIQDMNAAATGLLSNLRLGRPIIEVLDIEAASRLEAILGDDAEHRTREFEAFIDSRRFRLAAAGYADAENCLVIKVTDITEFRELSERVALSEQRFRSLFYENPDAVFSLDLEGRFVEANRGTLEMVGVSQPELIGCYWWDFVEPEDRQRIKANFLSVSAGDSFSFRCRVVNRDGRIFQTHVTQVPILVDQRVVGVFGIARDRTEHYRLEENRRLLSAAMARVHDVILITDMEPLDEPGPRIVFANESIAEITGYQVEDVLGASPRLFQGPETSLESLARIRAALDAREPIREELINYRKDGSPFWNEIEIVPIPARTVGERDYFASVQRDITESKQRQLELHKSREELRRLYSAQDSMLEQERLRIARDLHDELGQTLTALKLDLGVAVADSADLPTSHVRRLQELVHFVDGAIGQVREIAANLRPAMLDDLGFEAAAEWFLDKCAGRDGLDVRWRSHLDDGGRVTGDTATALYRILQECMTNISRHAQASIVTIDYEETPDRATLIVKDDGVGFETSSHRSAGFGLVGMRERVAMLGGKLAVDSTIGEGARLVVTLPLAGNRHD